MPDPPASPPVLSYAPAASRPWQRRIRRAMLGALVLVCLAATPYAWLYLGWKSEQGAIAKLPNFAVDKTAPIGPEWLSARLGRAGFVLQRVRVLNGNVSPVTDLSPVAALTRLERLYLFNMRVTELSALLKLGRLEELYLPGTPVTDLSPLSGLTELRVLALDGTKVTGLSPLSRLTKLRALSLDATPVTDLSPLSKLTGLDRLFLDGTRITDLSPLSKLTALQYLSVRAEAITWEQVDKLQQSLPKCDIRRW